MDRRERSKSRMRQGRYGSAAIQNQDSTKLLKPPEVTNLNPLSTNQNDHKAIKQIINDAIKDSNRKEKIKSKKDRSSSISRSISSSGSSSYSREKYKKQKSGSAKKEKNKQRRKYKSRSNS